ncbi:HET-domain-containing protein [Microthyrium microscopicum]|uniref:HET-domain-containing protein n=1 Tax=Microthyrium microscopicum TaxID=703497 RepID=A0A6A6U9G8_9PEZI|nr:HET-domain-containing protein [Microthyrium microscopicum]
MPEPAKGLEERLPPDERHRPSLKSSDIPLTVHSDEDAEDDTDCVEEAQLTTQKRPPYSSIGGSNLCERCQKIDFELIFNVDMSLIQSRIQPWEYSSILVPEVIGEHSSKTCLLCRTSWDDRFALSLVSYLERDRTINFGECSDELRAKDIRRLCVNKYDYFDLIKDDWDEALLFKPRIVADQDNFDQAREWLNFCSSHHRVCQERENLSIGLKLIDCETYHIVAAREDTAYVALSYVWGTPSERSRDLSVEDVGRDPIDTDTPKYSRTIRDAMYATRALGHRYLWVDKHCIDQHNLEERHKFVSQMDVIYKAADVTIIAASGKDCHAGLPGINGSPRSQRAHVAKHGKFSIIPADGKTRAAIQDSTWASRGWTFQEAVLSARRLVFTERELYYECNAMNCCESMAPNLSALHKPGMSDSFSWCPPGLFSGIIPPNDARNSLKNKPTPVTMYTNLIMQYTERTLTYEEDRPKAFQGIMAHVRKIGIHQLWGTCCFASENSSALSAKSEVYTSFTQCLMWSGIPKYINLAAIDHISIPSWSWMGWTGKILFRPHEILECEIQSIKIELHSQPPIDLATYYSETLMRPSNHLPNLAIQPTVILLEAYFVDPGDLTFMDHSTPIRLFNESYLHFNVHRGIRTERTIYDLLLSRTLELFLICSDFDRKGQSEDDPGYTYLMVVENHPGFALRAGTCRTFSLKASLIKQKGCLKTIRLA